MSKDTSQRRARRPDGVSRRSFFASMGGLAGGAAIAAVSPSNAEAQTGTAQNEKSSSGYRETEHVKTYYDLARF